ncbi:MAG: ThuA domain-containing protein [Pseudomonadales bacterium]
MPRNLIIHGGIYHPFASTSAVLAAIFDDCGVETDMTEDVEAGLAALADYDLLTINALRWRMLDHPKYLPFRDRYAMTLSDAGRAAIERHLTRGGALLGLHTAAICFGDWPGWGDILGGRWAWGRSFHPPEQQVEVRVAQGAHSICAGIEDFVVTDEIFHHLEPTAAWHALLTARATPDGAEQSLCWTHEWGAGRVFYDALGHTKSSLLNRSHRQLLAQATRWLLRMDTA